MLCKISNNVDDVNIETGRFEFGCPIHIYFDIIRLHENVNM